MEIFNIVALYDLILDYHLHLPFLNSSCWCLLLHYTELTLVGPSSILELPLPSRVQPSGCGSHSKGQSWRNPILAPYLLRIFLASL